MAPLPPKTSLSKGTLGLKFMNRTVPGPVSAPASPANSSTTGTPARGTAETPTLAVLAKVEVQGTPLAAGRMSFGAPSAVKKAEEKEENWGSRKVAGSGSRATVVHETSLLSFPLLSNLYTSSSSSTSTSTSTFSSSSTYSSMPLTSTTISGRRSFGGANVEIEKLNDPTSHQPKDSKDSSSSKESKSQLKKRQKAERDNAPLTVRRSAGGSSLSSAKVGKRTAALDAEREESGSAKKRRLAAVTAAGDGEGGEMDPMRWEADDDHVSFSGSSAPKPKKEGKKVVPPTTSTTKKGEFARPGGFEGAKKGGAGKGKGKGGMGDYQWGKQGDKREWDEGKNSDEEDESSREEDEEDLTAAFDAAESSGSETSDESGGEVEEMLMKGKQVGGPKGEKEVKKGKFVGGAKNRARGTKGRR
ncbi:hypothetical protein JCM11641_000829 [Rhodosporidiobolus odoratus]